MEFERKIGGIGLFSLNGRESRFLRGFFDLKNEDTERRTHAVHLAAPAQTTIFLEMMETLFPGIEAKPYPDKIYVVTINNQNPYECGGAERVIPLQSRLSYHPGPLDLYLHLITPQPVESFDFSICYVTCTLPNSYAPTCVDDIAQLLGEYQTTIPMEKITPIQLRDEKEKCAYGIADVRNLPNVFRVYQRAVQVIDNAPRVINLNRGQIDILRRDAASHENVAVRDLSKERYATSLQKLIEQ